jgi:hypothetical protein
VAGRYPFSRRLLVASCALLLLAATPLSAKDKKKGPISPEIRPDMLVEVPGLEIAKAQKPCDNWAWWAAVQTTFEQQNVPLPQSYFVDRADGGACLNEDHPLTLYDVATSIPGDYALPNGRRFHAEAKLGDTAVPAAFIVSALRAGRPLIMSWRKRPFIVQGIVFDDHVFPGDQHQLQPKELHLINITNGEAVKLALDDDDATADIVGVIDITVSEIKK